MTTNKEDIGKIEWLLKTRTYTEKERNSIIDLVTRKSNIIYDKEEKKFMYEVLIHKFGLNINSWLEEVVPSDEEKEYAM
jgi:hypothetical protein